MNGIPDLARREPNCGAPSAPRRRKRREADAPLSPLPRNPPSIFSAPVGLTPNRPDINEGNTAEQGTRRIRRQQRQPRPPHATHDESPNDARKTPSEPPNGPAERASDQTRPTHVAATHRRDPTRPNGLAGEERWGETSYASPVGTRLSAFAGSKPNSPNTVHSDSKSLQSKGTPPGIGVSFGPLECAMK